MTYPMKDGGYALGKSRGPRRKRAQTIAYVMRVSFGVVFSLVEHLAARNINAPAQSLQSSKKNL